jgi:hypothetical protein
MFHGDSLADHCPGMRNREFANVASLRFGIGGWV